MVGADDDSEFAGFERRTDAVSADERFVEDGAGNHVDVVEVVAELSVAGPSPEHIAPPVGERQAGVRVGQRLGHAQKNRCGGAVKR